VYFDVCITFISAFVVNKEIYVTVSKAPALNAREPRVVVCASGNMIHVYNVPELDTGRVHPRVGSGWGRSGRVSQSRIH